MKRNGKVILSCVGIVLATVMLLGLVQALVMPKYMSVSREGSLISEYYKETTDHDVIFIGDCEVYECFTPPTLWEEYGITSYIRGSAQQLAWQSYYLLEETLQYETPKVVVYNVYALKYGTPQNEEYNRMTLDGMKWSRSKVEAIRASMTEDESFLSYLFPLFRFHSRWSELSSEDFTYLFSRDTVSHNGYLMQTGVKPMTGNIQPPPTNQFELAPTAMEYLDKMRTLCAENGVEFVLMKAPTNSWRYYWYNDWDNQICEYAEQHNLAYYNFIPQCDEIGIDWSRDTYDNGAHLNVYGAEKLTSYFGKILSERHQIPDRRADATLSAAWAAKCDTYKREKGEE